MKKKRVNKPLASMKKSMKKNGKKTGKKRGKKWRVSDENDAKKGGLKRGVYKALKRPPARGKKPMKTSRVEKRRVE